MVHLSIIGGLIFVLSGSPATGSCLRSFEKTSLSSVSTLDGADLSAQHDERNPLYKDVRQGDWTYVAVERLLRRNVIRFYPYGYFSGKPIRTRFEFAVAIQRSVNMIAAAVKPQETPAKARQTEGDEQAPPGPLPSAEDLKLLRKLHLEFKAHVAALGEDWKAMDSSLQKLQDQVLHRDLTEALAAGLPKTDEAAPGLGSKVVPRPNWAYDALKQLSHTKEASQIPEGRPLTRDEFAGIIRRAWTPFVEAEIIPLDGSAGPVPSPLPYRLSEVIALHKLVHAFRVELAPSRLNIVGALDIVVVEKRLAQAEEKRITAEEIIDMKPPVLPTESHHTP